MYESIRGVLKEKSSNTAIVECGGLSYRLSIPLSTYLRLGECGLEILLYLSHIVREDAHTLYAFIAKEERNLFEMLLSVSGIGPKTAANIIGHMELPALKSAFLTADVRTLSQIPGIGKKSAERLVIEMRDKIKAKEGSAPGVLLASVPCLSQDATRALVNLGYHVQEAQKAVEAALADNPDHTLSLLISAALKKIH